MEKVCVPTVVTFEQITNLPSDALGTVLCHVENQILEWAMVGATRSAQRAVFRALSAEGCELLRAKLLLLGTVNLEVTAMAQRQILSLVCLVEGKGVFGVGVRLAS